MLPTIYKKKKCTLGLNHGLKQPVQRIPEPIRKIPYLEANKKPRSWRIVTRTHI